MVNHFYTAKVCLNGNGYLKRQLAKEGIAFEALDNGVLSCADAGRAQAICDELDEAKIDQVVRKWRSHPPNEVERDAGDVKRMRPVPGERQQLVLPRLLRNPPVGSVPGIE